jgi:thiol-disulfide isomerase/thioredoxin
MKIDRKKRELIEWVVLISVFGILYITGLHTEVLGQLQRAILTTGIISPSVETESEIAADYNLRLKDSEGNILDMSALKGKTIFMNYWATWCPPCIAEMPNINNLHAEVNDDVEFLMISLDDEPQKAIDFVKKKEYSFPIYFLASSKPSVYSSNAIPSTYVISPEGKIVVSHSGMAKYNSDSFKKYLLSL